MQLGNGSGSRPSDMPGYDSLPSEIRQVLRYAPRPFSAATVRENWIGHGRPPMRVYIPHMVATLRRRFPGWSDADLRKELSEQGH